MTRKKKLETANQLIHSTGASLTAEEQAFLKKHGHKQQAFMFVHAEEDKQKAENILKRIDDKDTIVVVISEEDLKL